MELIFRCGCTCYNVDVDGKNFLTMNDEQCINITKYVLSNLEHVTSQTEVLIDNILDIINSCKKSITNEVTYGDEEFEKISVSLLNTKSYRTRSFYDFETQENWLTIGSSHSSVCSITELVKVYNELIEILYQDTTNQNELNYIFHTLLCGIVREYGKVVNISDRCECCGDIIYTYMLNL